MTTPSPLHPVLLVPLPPRTEPVQLALRDWPWASNSRRRYRLVAAVLATYGRLCHLCGTPGATTADHLVPWSHGGRNEVDNLRPAHQGCNSVRQDAPLVDWFQRHPIRAVTMTPSREW